MEYRQGNMKVFRILGRIKQLEHEQRFHEQAELIERETYDSRWRGRIPSAAVVPNPEFREISGAKFDSRLRQLRKKQLDISSNPSGGTMESPKELAKIMLQLGEIYLLEGSYRDADNCFLGMRGAGSEESYLSMALMSHINILQGSWSALHTSNPQYMPIIYKIQDEEVATELVVDYALALWISREYADCISLLLSVKPAFYGKYTTWLSKEQLQTLVELGSVATLSRENLQILVSDPECSCQGLVESFLALDVTVCWETVHKLCEKIADHWFLAPTIEHISKLLHKRILTTYLGVHSKCRLSTVLELFDIKLLELIDLAKEWDLSLLIKPTDDTITWTKNTRIDYQNLGPQFIRDSFVHIWHNEALRLAGQFGAGNASD